jgi:hypothetical protein
VEAGAEVAAEVAGGSTDFDFDFHQLFFPFFNLSANFLIFNLSFLLINAVPFYSSVLVLL